jgi:hypothetical protein
MPLRDPSRKRSATVPMMLVGFFGGVATVILVVR